MPRLTEELIRKKAEHNDGILADLEEISLHQLELERIEAIGPLCRKMRILYLQNNIISKMENLYHMKDLRYLNLALNNVAKVEGLECCEFLEKLDMTVNFIDVDTLEESVTNLTSNRHLRELYLMGNPCTSWEGLRHYVVARLPTLELLDGKQVVRSERILATQRLPALQQELQALAAARRAEKSEAAAESGVSASAPGSDKEDAVPYTPETRREMYMEIAERKAAEEKRRKEMAAPERDYDREHRERLQLVREQEQEGRPRQCNEGRWEFRLDDEDGNGNIVLELDLPRHLDTSLIDVDAHPSYVSVVIKGKLFRLNLPEEVRSEAGTAHRSKATGNLVLTMPKVRGVSALAALKHGRGEKVAPAVSARKPAAVQGSAAAPSAPAAGRVKRTQAPPKLGDEMLAAALAAKAGRTVAGDGGVLLREASTRRVGDA